MIRRRFQQVLLLALLAAAGAGLYLSRGGDVPRLVTALLAREAAPGTGPSAAPMSQPSEVAVARPAPGAARMPAVPPRTARAVPKHAVEGELDGRRFRLDRAWLESGVLRLRQQEPALEVELVLPINPWIAPAGRSFEVLAPQARAPDTPLVRVRVPAAGASAATRAFAARYTLWLEFGRERNGALPGKLHLSLPDAAGSRVAGTFLADLRGFRFVDGEPDLSIDSVETLEFLALREILRRDPGQALAHIGFRAATLTPAQGTRPAAGYLEVRHGPEAGAVWRAFRFVKEAGRWRVHMETPGGGGAAGR